MARCSLHCALWGQRSPGQDLFSLGVTGGDTWGDLATDVFVDVSFSNTDDDDGRPMPYEIWRGEYNVPGEVGFRPVSAGQGHRANSEDNYGWLIPIFFTINISSFPTPWPWSFQTPGDALCQLVFHAWLTEAYNQGSLPESDSSSRVTPPKIFNGAKGNSRCYQASGAGASKVDRAARPVRDPPYSCLLRPLAQIVQ